MPTEIICLENIHSFQNVLFPRHGKKNIKINANK